MALMIKRSMSPTEICALAQRIAGLFAAHATALLQAALMLLGETPFYASVRREMDRLRQTSAANT